MAFMIAVFQTLLKAVFVGAFAFAGILLGKNLRKRKNAKLAMQKADSVETK